MTEKERIDAGKERAREWFSENEGTVNELKSKNEAFKAANQASRESGKGGSLFKEIIASIGDALIKQLDNMSKRL